MAKILIQNARVFDGTGAAVFDGYVLTDGARIADVGHGSPATGIADADVLDAGGATLLPGLIDGHTHLAFGSTLYHMAKPAQRSDAETALLIAHCGRVLLESGFTSAYSGGSASPQAEIAAKQAFDAGWVPGPRLRTSSFERAPGGAMGLKTRFPGAAVRASAPADAVAFVKEMAALGVESVKFLLNGVSAFDPGSNLRDQFHDEEIVAGAAAAREAGLSLTAHCYTPHSIELAVRAGFRVLYHCNYAEAKSLDALESKKAELFVGPAPGIVEADLTRGPKFGIMASPEQRDEQAEATERLKGVGRELRARGIRTVPGGDYGFPWNPIGRNARDLTLFVEWFGYTPAEALLCATRTGGELLGRGHELGQLRPGYLADFLLVKGDPTRDIALLEAHENLLAIVKDGQFHKRAVAG